MEPNHSIDMKKVNHVKSMVEALKMLDEAACGIRDAAGDQLGRITDQAIDSTKKAAEFVDHSAHKNPWYFVGGAAALTGLAGYIIGSRTTKH